MAINVAVITTENHRRDFTLETTSSANHFLDQLKSQDLTGKKVALFGCGDSSSFSDTFCSAMGEIHDGLAATGCTFVGQVDASGYTYDDSAAESGGKFVGLALDEVNEDDKTDGRIDAWAAQLKSEGVE